MVTRSIASLSLSFGLVSIPVKLYSATESSAAVKFKLLANDGSRVRQQYVSERTTVEAAPAAPLQTRSFDAVESAPEPAWPGHHEAAAQAKADDVAARPVDARNADDEPSAAAPVAALRMESRVEQLDVPVREPAVVDRSEMVKGYEFEKGRFVLFTAAELKALEEGSRQTIDIVSFVPQGTVDPLYYDKAYFLAPDKRGGKPYTLLLKAMRQSGQCALAKWAWRSKEYVVQIRPAEGGLVLQQLLYAEEVRSLDDLHIDLVEVGDAELQLALKLIEQIAVPSYDPTQFVDEERQRIMAAVEKKIAGNQVAAPEQHEPTVGGRVIDLVEALRASLRVDPVQEQTSTAPASVLDSPALGPRKPVRRARQPAATIAAPARRRAKG